MNLAFKKRPLLKKGQVFHLFLLLPFIGIYLFLEAQGILNSWQPQSKIALVLFFTAAYLWVTEIIPLHVTSFVILSIETVWLFPLLKQAEPDISKKIFFAPFFSDIILLFMGGFVMSDLLQRYGISRKIARAILGGPARSPAGFTFSLMAITAFFSMWISNTATTAMLLALLVPILQDEKVEPNSKKLLPVSVAFAANIGGLATPIGTPPNAIALGYLARAGISVSFFEWMILTLPVVIFLLLVIHRLLLKIYPIRQLPEVSFGGTDSTIGSDRKQIAVCIIFFLTVISWMTAGIHPLSNGEVSLVLMIAVFGTGLLNVKDFNKLSWNILMILGGGLALGVAIEKSGMASEVIAMIPMDHGESSLLGGIMVTASFLTTFINNTATANLIIPLFAEVKEFAFSAVMITTIMCSTNMALSISTPPNVLAFGMGNLKFRDLFIPGVIISAISMVLMFPFLYYISWIFHFLN